MEAKEKRDLEMPGGLLLPKVPFDLTLALRCSEILELLTGGFFLVALVLETENIEPETKVFIKVNFSRQIRTFSRSTIN